MNLGRATSSDKKFLIVYSEISVGIFVTIRSNMLCTIVTLIIIVFKILEKKVLLLLFHFGGKTMNEGCSSYRKSNTLAVCTL